ncbi:MAG: hypothetical protein HOM11_01725 [Methylococcales bacterium]|jgi:hypothetical protein|nr:hypothetical protein [Methylococcales bacterium]MBT7442397.1 hypothetical protein [Methylococcales bacterium]
MAKLDSRAPFTKKYSQTTDAIVKEIERTVKTRKRYEAIFAIYLQTIKRGEYDSIHYVCPDLAFANRLEQLFNLINEPLLQGNV